MKTLFGEMRQGAQKGEQAVLVTIIASSGSTPRGAGSRMLVKQDGTAIGTIGGGNVEYLAIQAAMEAMEKRQSFVRGYSLTREQTASIGMVCGGDVRVCFQYISPEDETVIRLCDQVLEALGRDENSWLYLDMTREEDWKMGVYPGDVPAEVLEHQAVLFTERAHQTEADGRSYYTEPLVQAGTVYVFGGGHVAQKLVPVLAGVGFRCVVMDDRPRFANSEMFPDAVQTIVGDLEHIGDFVQVRHCDYVCVMTRGHQYDYLVQKQMLLCRPYYIGIMGSRNKIRTITEKLLEEGFSREEIEACHMPIGMAIKAETPEEIAISIAGELILARAERGGIGFEGEVTEKS